MSCLKDVLIQYLLICSCLMTFSLENSTLMQSIYHNDIRCQLIHTIKLLLLSLCH